MDIVTRAQWGANYTSAYYRVGMAEKDEFFVHYHGGEPSASVGVWVPRNVEAIHHANGWSGVGYNFVVDQAGTIYEGRGWDGVAVACPDHNRRGIHVYVAVGGSQEATDAAKRSVVALRDEHRRLRALGKHSRPTDRLVHGDKYPTACAGPTLTPWVHSGYPLTTTAPVPEEDIMASIDDLKGALKGVLEDSNFIKIIGTGTSEENPVRYMSVVTALRVMYDRTVGHDKRIDQIEAKVDGAVAALLAASPDPEKLAEAADKAFRDRLAKLSVVDREDATTTEVQP